MSKFKVGDRVKYKDERRSSAPDGQGLEFTIQCIDSRGEAFILEGGYRGITCSCGKHSWFISDSEAELIETPNTSFMSSVKSFIKKITRKEPEKSFVEAGFLDENEELTSKGREALEYVLWEANKEAVKKIADQIIEAEAEKK